MRLSIILPVYKVEQFLADCFNSLFCQDVPESDYEIICVNDGTPDNSLSIVKEYMKKHPSIKLYEQENGGVSKARNAGLSAATGDYIWFVDPDDMIISNCLGKMLSELENKNADIFEFVMQRCDEDKKFEKTDLVVEISGENKLGSEGGAVQYIVRREYLLKNSITFNGELKYGEDYLWAFQVKFRKQKNIYSNTPVYIYRQRQGSAMHSTRDKKQGLHHLDDMILLSTIYKKELVRCKNENLGEAIYKNIIDRINLCTQSVLIDMIKLDLSKSEKKQTFERLKNEKLYPYKPMWWNVFSKSRMGSPLSGLIMLAFPLKAYYNIFSFLSKKIKH